MKTNLTVDTILFNYCKAKLWAVSTLHCHKVYEIYYLLSGRRSFFIDHKTYDVEAGDIILIPPNTVHQSLKAPYTHSNEFHERYLLCPEVEDIPTEFEKLFSKHYFHLTANDSEFIRTELENIKAETEHKDAYSPYLYKASLLRILTVLSRNYLSELTLQKQFEKRIDQIIENVQEHIKNNADKPLTLSDTAAQFGITEGYLSSAFKSATGLGFSRFLTKTRIAKSVKLLAKNDISISEIAVRCGFNNSNYFATVFKKAMGVTPTEYRCQTNSIV